MGTYASLTMKNLSGQRHIPLNAEMVATCANLIDGTDDRFYTIDDVALYVEFYDVFCMPDTKWDNLSLEDTRKLLALEKMWYPNTGVLQLGSIRHQYARWFNHLPDMWHKFGRSGAYQGGWVKRDSYYREVGGATVDDYTFEQIVREQLHALCNRPHVARQLMGLGFSKFEWA